MSAIRLEEFFPNLPRPGWPGRRRAIAIAVLQVVGGVTFLLALLAVAYVAILFVGAKAGAL